MTTNSQQLVSEVNSRLETVTSNDHERFDGSFLPITGHELNGNNYLQWSQSVHMYIGGKDKDGYLTREIIQPKSDDPRFRTWKTENNMVKSWLINPMTNEIDENFLLYKTTKEMWDVVKETYSTKENTAKQVDIETVLHDLHQGDLTVTNYYNILGRH